MAALGRRIWAMHGERTVTPFDEERTQAILNEVLDERREQHEKWGQQDHADGEWAIILGEEVGEVMAEVVEISFHGKRAGNLVRELRQVVAVAVAWMEAIDRRSEATNRNLLDEVEAVYGVPSKEDEIE